MSRRVQLTLPWVLAPVLLAGCSGASDGAAARKSEQAGKQGTPSATATEPGAAKTVDVIKPDPARVPKTRAAALDLIHRVIADPDNFGPGVVKRTPYESDPATWPVLGEDCVWQQKKPGADVLATLTRSFEVPASGSKGPIRLAAVITVHRTRADARWEMAESIEETMRCPTQQLRDGEQIGSMMAGALFGGEGNQTNSEDTLDEMGKYQSTELGGPYHYVWLQAQALQFTVAVTGKGAKGRTQQEIDGPVARAQAMMLVNLASAVEKRS
ncbi:hypothetical protein [Streptomyces sp. NPDC058045]|uniref:hypothetical protein n=1 Tax=Streptomyces sp. NPDC058045 TaxID=3346311 RepID=UPI0036F07B6F